MFDKSHSKTVGINKSVTHPEVYKNLSNETNFGVKI